MYSSYGYYLAAFVGIASHVMWKYQCQSVNILLITTEKAQNDIGQQIEAL